MTAPGSEAFELRRRREKALVEIAKRDHVTPVELQLFRVASIEDFRRIAVQCLDEMTDGREKAAIENALGGIISPTEERTLGERRDQFEKDFGVSLSTTVRLERAGGEKLAFRWTQFEDSAAGDQSRKDSAFQSRQRRESSEGLSLIHI